MALVLSPAISIHKIIVIVHWGWGHCSPACFWGYLTLPGGPFCFTPFLGRLGHRGYPVSSLCILITLLYARVLLLISFLVPFFRRTLLMALKGVPLRVPVSFYLLQQEVIPALQERDCLETTVFMKDGALTHIARPVQSVIRAHFGDDPVISRSFPTA
ncbi:hypothetical protein AVEN_170388-1 [Araneus ventricosus]|uniref:Uncharacterized protein n=1 Tax=Araneus ventricosus TaxID=182803 RepID=A0A4Y2RN94_ARAVE|nr:hypothetical protein AVEN_170388-1 [Araneus ventricosus]